MPASTRHSAAHAGQQSKLNFTSKKNISQQKAITHDIVFRASNPPSKPREEQKVPGVADADEKDEVENEIQKNEDTNEELQEPEVGLAREDTAQPHDAAKFDNNQEEEEGALFQEELIRRQRLDLVSVSKELSDKAYKITPRQIQKYYKTIENSRIHPAVHQEGLTEYERILRHFDLSSQYGPCVGVSRFKRWSRAERLGLEPPIEVLAVLFKSELGEGVDEPPKDWESTPISTREDVGAVAYINKLVDTHTD